MAIRSSWFAGSFALVAAVMYGAAIGYERERAGSPLKSFIGKIRRLADGLPKDAVVNIEHERSNDAEEIEFQIVWKTR